MDVILEASFEKGRVPIQRVLDVHVEVRIRQELFDDEYIPCP